MFSRVVKSVFFSEVCCVVAFFVGPSVLKLLVFSHLRFVDGKRVSPEKRETSFFHFFLFGFHSCSAVEAKRSNGLLQNGFGEV